MSLERDSLPMWNYYVKDGSYFGYSIKFNRKEIIKELDAVDGKVFFGQVVYEKDKQIEAILGGIERAIDTFNKRCSSGMMRAEAREQLVDDFYEFFQSIRLFLKQPGFAHEREYRIAICTDGESLGGIKHRTKAGIIIPYVEVEFQNQLPIGEIVLSPTIEKRIGEIGLESLLKAKGCETSISTSKIQVRY